MKAFSSLALAPIALVPHVLAKTTSSSAPTVTYAVEVSPFTLPQDKADENPSTRNAVASGTPARQFANLPTFAYLRMVPRAFAGSVMK